MAAGLSNIGNVMQNPVGAARAAMLRMAQSAQANGQVYHAIHTYNHLLEEYPNTEESRQAAEEMIALAQFLETQGMYHTALSLYERMEQLR